MWHEISTAWNVMWYQIRFLFLREAIELDLRMRGSRVIEWGQRVRTALLSTITSVQDKSAFMLIVVDFTHIDSTKFGIYPPKLTLLSTSFIKVDMITLLSNSSEQSWCYDFALELLRAKSWLVLLLNYHCTY